MPGEEVPWSTVGDVGGVTFALFVFWMVMTGRLVTKAQYQVMVDAVTHWREAHAKEQSANILNAQASAERNAVDETVVKFVTSIQDAAARQSGGDR